MSEMDPSKQSSADKWIKFGHTLSAAGKTVTRLFLYLCLLGLVAFVLYLLL